MNAAEPVLLVGAGAIGIEYAKVLRALDRNCVVIGRNAASAAHFAEATGQQPFVGGTQNWINSGAPIPSEAIICVNGDQLGDCSRLLMEAGVKRLLVEKPAGLDEADILKVEATSRTKGCEVYVAYNRRFYSSVLAALPLIAEDGGVTSFNFEFTEWSHVVENVPASIDEKRGWFLHNSTHVVNLAFYLGGKPRDLVSFRAGALSWHPSGSAFAGAGQSEIGALFSYSANWDAPGRWSVEVLTRNRRYIFRPLEKLQIQQRKSVAIEEYPIDASLDTTYKPGLYREVHDFLGTPSSALTTLKEHVGMLSFYRKICPGGGAPDL